MLPSSQSPERWPKPWALPLALLLPQPQLLAGLLLALGMGLGLPAAQAQTSATAPKPSTNTSALSPQERLDAIRLSLVEASLQTPTKVQSTTWMDHRGVMHEASSFKNGLQVQGVRVMGFERDEQGAPKAWLNIAESSATTGKPAIKKEAKVAQASIEKNDASCPSKSTADHLRHVVKFALEMPSDTHPLVAQGLPALLQEQWLGPQAQPSTQAWRFVSDLSRPLLAREVSAYERLLLSTLPPEMPWQATLKVTARPAMSSGVSWLGPSTPHEVDLSMTLSLSPTDRHRASQHVQTSLTLEMDLPEWRRPTLTASSQRALSNQLMAWHQTLNQWLMCEVVQPAVTAARQQQLIINAGALAGVQPGEEWLIADPARFPQHLAAKDGAPQTLLARVDAVSAHEAMLTVLAGPTQAVQPNWRAWPTQTLRQDTPVSLPVTALPKSRSNLALGAAPR